MFLAHCRRFGLSELVVLAETLDASTVTPRLADGVALGGLIRRSFGSRTGGVFGVVDADALRRKALVLGAAVGGVARLRLQSEERSALRGWRAIVRIADADDGWSAACCVGDLLYLTRQALVSLTLLRRALDAAFRVALALLASVFRLPCFSCSFMIHNYPSTLLIHVDSS